MSGKTLVLTQSIPNATPEQVYAAFTTHEGLAQWWWPHIPDTTYRIDARVGGNYDIRSAVAGIGVRGVFVALTPHTHLRFTWNWMNDGISKVEEEIEVGIEPNETGSTLTLRHYLSPQTGDGDDFRQGWTDVLARLPNLWSRTP